jgi:hypothetical protein
MVTKSKVNGGFGVINLRLQNEVLLMKNLHKFLKKIFHGSSLSRALATVMENCQDMQRNDLFCGKVY